MKKWISKFFLFAALALVLVHNIVAHHHADENLKGFRDNHHSFLERVRMDHVFYTDYAFSNDLQAIIPAIVYGFEFNIALLPVKTVKPVIVPDEPYPPSWISNQTILRGPPVNC